MENIAAISKIINLCNDTYESEQAWHGNSVVESLRDVTPDIAKARLTNNTHSIAEIVFHMTSWRIFTTKKLQGDIHFQINTPEKDWKKIENVSDLEWEALQIELSLSQEELMSELEYIQSDDILNEIVPGSNYTYYNLIHGLINHDIYHSGQINLIKKGSSVLT